jgi:5'-nucleotidase
MPPRILITNDDGIHAPGLHALEATLARVGEIYTVAPMHEQSAASRRITLRKPSA